MKLAYAAIIAGLGCWCAAVVAGLLAVLPEDWVGYPYMQLAEAMNPGIDAPDTWAMGFTYFQRIVIGTASLGVVFTGLGWLLLRRAKRHQELAP